MPAPTPQTLAPALADPAAPWWRQVPEHQRDWWMRRLGAMPNADTRSFNDPIFAAPSAEGTRTLGFDSMGYSEPQWQAQQDNRLLNLARPQGGY